MAQVAEAASESLPAFFGQVSNVEPSETGETIQIFLGQRDSHKERGSRSDSCGKLAGDRVYPRSNFPPFDLETTIPPPGDIVRSQVSARVPNCRISIRVHGDLLSF